MSRAHPNWSIFFWDTNGFWDLNSLGHHSGQMIIFHQPGFSWNSRGFPLLSYLLGAQVVWGRYNLTRKLIHLDEFSSHFPSLSVVATLFCTWPRWRQSKPTPRIIPKIEMHQVFRRQPRFFFFGPSKHIFSQTLGICWSSRNLTVWHTGSSYSPPLS